MVLWILYNFLAHPVLGPTDVYNKVVKMWKIAIAK